MLSLLAHAETPLTRYIVKFRVAADKYYPLASLTGLGALPKERFKDISIQFGPTVDESAVAECNHSTLAITICKDKWDRYDEWDKEQIVFHELGHCVLGREHTSAMMGDIPASLMHPRMLPYGVYLLHRDYYQQELFSP